MHNNIGGNTDNKYFYSEKIIKPIHEGRGSFLFIASKDLSYYLKLDNNTNIYKIPAPKEEGISLSA